MVRLWLVSGGRCAERNKEGKEAVLEGSLNRRTGCGSRGLRVRSESSVLRDFTRGPRQDGTEKSEAFWLEYGGIQGACPAKA